MSCTSEKSAIRKQMRSRRQALSAAERTQASETICRQLLERCDQTEPKIIAVYLASPVEIELARFIEAMKSRGATLVAPRWNGVKYELAKLTSLASADLRLGPMGIREPKLAEIVAPGEVTLWIVPALAFTSDGKRLGYGGGWYDRLLAEANDNALTLGVAYDFQLVPDLPCEEHDVRVGEIIGVPLP